MRHALAFLLVAAISTAVPVRKAGADWLPANRIAEAHNQFAVSLYRHIPATDGNVCFSPHSVFLALAMTAQGARGDTEEEFARVLGLRPQDQELADALAAWRKRLSQLQEQRAVQMAVANSLWPQQGYRLREEFVVRCQQWFDATVRPLDYERNADGARVEINRWVAEQTRDKIRDLIPQGVLDRMTRLVLVNAIYFLANWADPFDQDATREMPFHVSENKTVPVPMMYRRGDYELAEVEGRQVLALPYKEPSLVLLAVLPARGEPLGDFERTLSADRWASWLNALRRQEVEVFLPRFKVRTNVGLKPLLQSLGLRQAFEPGRANFRGMVEDEELFISEALHEAVVEVDEKGTEAAAATGIVVSRTSLPTDMRVFRADRPFLFAIVDRAGPQLLFLGRVVNPAAS